MLKKELLDGALKLSVSLDEKTADKMLRYLVLIERWNRIHNLTAIRDIQKMVHYHLLDSLSILPYIEGTHLLDVGSGAGLPGIPVALACPSKQVVLLEAQNKKATFLVQAITELALSNCEVVCARAEAYQPTTLFDTIMFRAVGALQTVIDQTRHLCAPKGLWLAMKGHHPTEELAQLDLEATVHPLTVPGINAQRCVVTILNRRYAS